MTHQLLCFSKGNYYYLPGHQDPLLCGNSSDAGYGHVTPNEDTNSVLGG